MYPVRFLRKVSGPSFSQVGLLMTRVVDHPSRNNALVTDVCPQMSTTYSSRMVSIQHLQRSVVHAQDIGGEHQFLEPEIDRLKACVDEKSDHAHPGAQGGIGEENTQALITASVKIGLKRYRGMWSSNLEITI